MRASYRDDAGFILRLEAAITKDNLRTETWIKTGAGLARQLAQFLLTADSPDNLKVKVSSQSPRRK